MTQQKSNNLHKVDTLLVTKILLAAIAVAFLVFFAGIKSGVIRPHDLKLKKVSLTQMVGDVFKEEKFEVFSVQDEHLGMLYKEALVSPDYYIRKYQSKLCYGFDARNMSSEDIRYDNDTLFIKIPQIQLLDENFLNESAEHTLFEKPTNWDTRRKELVVGLRDLVEAQAVRKMEIKGYYESAVEAAETEIASIFQSFGFKNVIVKAQSRETAIRYDYRQYPEVKHYLGNALPAQPFIEERYFLFNNGTRLYYNASFDYSMLLPLVDYVQYSYRDLANTSLYAEINGNIISFGEVIYDSSFHKKAVANEAVDRIDATFIKENIYPDLEVLPVVWQHVKNQNGPKYAFQKRDLSIPSEDTGAPAGTVTDGSKNNLKSVAAEAGEKVMNKLKGLTKKKQDSSD